MDSLKRRVLAYDRERNTPYQMRVTARSVEPGRICVLCRRVPEEAMFAEWHKKWLAASAAEREDLPTWRVQVGDDCPQCGGRLVGVTW